LVTLSTTEGAAHGAALLAATGAGAFPDVESACAAVNQPTGRTVPGLHLAAYESLYPLYRALCPALRPTFNAIAQAVS
jgi:xylulokinase